ncbi:putative holin-like toxin [Staphylococcus equorum]|nr:putative holin-like toxin [Staphylococcus equorum]MDK9847092.1 putative holin-like toxin [Staphylococcus equorum]
MPCVVSIVEVLHLMLGFGTLIVTLLGLVITIVKLNHKK